MSSKLRDIEKDNPYLLKLLTQNLPDTLWVKDLEGKYIYANEAVCKDLFMLSQCSEIVGKTDLYFAKKEKAKHKENPHWFTFGELCTHSDTIVLENKKAMKFEEYGTIRGELVFYEVYKAPFYDHKGNLLGTVGAGRDITELKKTQLELKESLENLSEQKKQLELFNKELEERVEQEVQKQQKQKHLMLRQSRQAAMGEMLESIAHQWRQPLNIIGLATANLETQFTLGSLSKNDFQKKMDIIATNIRYMSSTIDDFRNFLYSNRKSEVFEPQQVIEETLKIVDTQLRFNTIRSSLDIKENFSFYGVANEFKQVLLILLNNSIDAIRSKKSKEKKIEGTIEIIQYKQKSCGIVDIIDNGGGIDARVLEKMFHPYVTTKKEAFGTGIGLYIAKNIVESGMKGRLSAKNLGEKTCLRIKIPLDTIDS